MARALGRYELLRPLARGGMADVYLARRRAAGIEKWLVVKRMRPERSGDPRFLDLFVREARLSMSLAHQNIVPVFDFGRIDDQVFLAMERVEGKDLGSSLARAAEHRMPPLLAAFIAAECCQALDYAHQRKGPDGVALGIVHRDVTPRNVLLSWSGEVKLTDFGIAALAGDATSRLLGTPQYMAPEQARSEPIDPRADIYAIGLVLRESITGIRPRPGTDRDAILESARRGALMPWPSDGLALGTDPDGAPLPSDAALIAIVDRATASAPDDRYPDVRAMLDELDAFIVAQRSAHKGDSPARQLAAWLASVWEGARDDAQADAAIEAEHLVSFLDDGAIDLLGTGTMRSMAATAAEDALLAPLAGAPNAPAAAAPPAAGPAPAAAPSPSPPPPRPSASRVTPATGLASRGEHAPRASRISSSNATVASGSFHTIPDPDARRGHVSKRRSIWLRSGLLVAAVAAGALAVLLGGYLRREPPQLAMVPNGAPRTTAPAGQDTVPPAVQSSVARKADGSSAHEPATAEHPGSNSRAGSGRKPPTNPTAAQLHITPSAPPAPPAPTLDGSSAPGGDRPLPQTCHVRINLTPWAYFTTDDDSTRHETPSTLDLTPGPHRLHVWNPELQIERDISIVVPADRDTMTYSAPLRPSVLAPGAP